jgi:hypothetical protein
MYEELLRLFGAGLPAEEKRAANEAIAALQKNVADLIEESDPVGATEIVDGKERGTTPLPRPQTEDGGTHAVRVFKEGYLPYETQLMLPGTHRRVVRAQLRALAQSGRLQVQEAEGRALDVIVDGAVMGKSPWSGTLAVGHHTVALRGADDLGAPPTAANVEANRTATLTLRATKLDAEMRIEPTPANARIDIDGVQVGSGVWEGRLQSGTHQIEVTADAFLAYRREVAVRAGQREVLRVALERDLTNPRWREDVFRPHIFVEVVAAGAVAPSFGGAADAACGRGECSKRTRPAGVLVGARGGYQLTSGLGIELFLGYMWMHEKMTRSQTAQADFSLTSTDYRDETTLSGPLFAASASYQFFRKMPLLFRLSAGAMRGFTTFKNGGTFSGTASAHGQSAAYQADLSIPETKPGVWVPVVGPEVRFGYRISRRLAVDLGVTVLLMFPLDVTRTGATSLSLKGTRRESLPEIPNGYPDGSTIRPGVANLPTEKAFGMAVAILPGISGRWDF